MIERLIITDIAMAADLVTQRDPDGLSVNALISIRDLGAIPSRWARDHHNALLLFFDDVDHRGPSHAPPQPDDARRLVAWAPKARGTLLVHCAAGISRSPAAALIVVAAQFGPGREEDACAFVIESLHQATRDGFREDAATLPNGALLWHGDALLGRHGALVKAAVEAWGPSLQRRVEFFAFTCAHCGALYYSGSVECCHEPVRKK